MSLCSHAHATESNCRRVHALHERAQWLQLRIVCSDRTIISWFHYESRNQFALTFEQQSVADLEAGPISMDPSMEEDRKHAMSVQSYQDRDLRPIDYFRLHNAKGKNATLQSNTFNR